MCDGARSESERIVFYDGVCALCNRFVKFASQRDRHGALHFSPLQGDTAASFDGLPRDVETIVYFEEGSVYTHSDAVLRAMEHLPAPWSWVSVCRIVPRGLRDLIYRRVARTRYDKFGRHEGLATLQRRY